MPNRNYQRGRAFEYKVKKFFEQQGCLVIRSAGSKGPIDLAVFPPAGDPRHPFLLQCKRAMVSKKERRELAELRCRLGLLVGVAIPDGHPDGFLAEPI
jgi:Holliday junction resolvase